MKLSKIVQIASNKEKFVTIEDYINFSKIYLEFVADGLQAIIVSQNENHYHFYQYKSDGHFNISRPINSNLIYSINDISKIEVEFLRLLKALKDISQQDSSRDIIKCGIYTIAQSVGAALDALPSGQSNTARKVNGDLFERLIQLLIKEIGIKCESGTVQVPVYLNKVFQFNMSYQHDLLLYNKSDLKVIGSVKTSSKDRIDKIFMDKFLYCKLTNTALPHIAIFLNDVQRKSTRRHDEYGINATFLPGHFKVYTVKLNPLDGVYYCDIRPNMLTDKLLKKHIRSIDHFFCNDIWSLLEKP
ncbi:hypothetical protein [Candidatus Magnetominusculus xianensis]|uniref:Restriction endonuclease n=1 Tax=Candidatus Magnetominusculus xianensis TaxID=1748249 RepID=A0ABR5SFD1_9BACT|nr:hypothetical protein [Candidatus Magnetominusculus xianensis]KWT84129.1 hypothetical protein ASN18_2057 [Candidatus Magnetominusculus xianensis]MBF0402423.1 hypothetical protein [Nitrospirota bacterium]